MLRFSFYNTEKQSIIYDKILQLKLYIQKMPLHIGVEVVLLRWAILLLSCNLFFNGVSFNQ